MITAPFLALEKTDTSMCHQTITSRLRSLEVWRRVGRHIWEDARGQELMELAFVFPLLLTLFFGIFWFARAYETSQTLIRAAREGARVALAPSCSKCTTPGTLPAVGTVATAVQNSLSAAGVDYTKVTTPGGCANANGSDPKICVATNVVLNPTSTLQEFGVVVSFNYPYTFKLPFVPPSLTSITLKTNVQMREENQ
jgi:Flp pilus assembly protein TadG